MTETITTAEARDALTPYYFRARHGRWTLTIGEPGWPTDFDLSDVVGWPDEHAASGDDPTRGAMAHADVLAIIAANVPVVIEGEVAP